MTIRTLACALLLGLGCAQAAPPEKKADPTPPQDIDVDAMARAKDAAATPPAEGAAAEAAPAKEKGAAAEAAPAEAAQAASDAPPEPPVETPAPAAEKPAGNAEQMGKPTPADTTGTERHLAAACEARAKSLLDAAQKGDYKTATRDFDAKMRSALPQPKFKEAWESLSQFGALQARGQSHPMKGEGYIAVAVPLIFEKANLYAQVACGSDGLIAGFYVKPLELPQPQPQPQPQP